LEHKAILFAGPNQAENNGIISMVILPPKPVKYVIKPYSPYTVKQTAFKFYYEKDLFHFCGNSGFFRFLFFLCHQGANPGSGSQGGGSFGASRTQAYLGGR
jgi:hypothetical protein